MQLFTSKKEKLLWFSTLLVIIAIYSTLGLAYPLSNYLRELGLLAPLFMAGMLMVMITLLLMGIKKRPNTASIGTALGVITVYLLLLLRIEIPAERTHIIEYSIVAAFMYQALLERQDQGRFVLAPALVSILGTGLLGGIDEIIQAILPNRVFDIRDILFNAMAGIMAVISIKLLTWVSLKTNKNNGV